MTLITIARFSSVVFVTLAFKPRSLRQIDTPSAVFTRRITHARTRGTWQVVEIYNIWWKQKILKIRESSWVTQLASFAGKSVI